MADTIVIETGDGEPDDENPPVEAEAVEAAADAQIAVAAIEAEARVEIEQIRADVEMAHAEARVAEAEAYNGHEEWRQNIEAKLSSLSETVALIQQSLIPAPETPPSETNPPLESAGVDPREVAEKQEAPEPPKRLKRPRWI